MSEKDLVSSAQDGSNHAAARIEILDLWRSLCVAVMLVYHLLYDLCLFGRLDAGLMETWPMVIIRFVFAGSFILISGVCVRFSRNPVRRGFIVFCAGALVTAVSLFAGYPVLFGALHLLGVCMILYGLLRERLERYRGPAFAAVCAALFAGTALLTVKVTAPASVKFLFPFGLTYPGFFSADYFPLLPWAFLFLIGTSLGKFLCTRDIPLPRKRYPAALTFPGRHSLLIYLLHQPVYWLIFTYIFPV